MIKFYTDSDIVIMVVRINCCETSPRFELGRKSICFNTDWPDQMFMMASRNWPNITINSKTYETQTTFFSGANMSNLDHQMVAWFLTTLDVVEFQAWLSTVGTKFAQDSITSDWLAEQSLNHDLKARFQIDMAGITTFPSASPGEQDTHSLHLAFLFDRDVQNVRNEDPAMFRPVQTS